MLLRGASLLPAALLSSCDDRSGAVVLSRARASVGDGDDKSSERRVGDGCVFEVSYWRLSVPVAVLLSTSAAKLSRPACWVGSGRAERSVAP
ncbi:hypothetical protein MTX20_05920 [Bradyrhizobium sp. ISRA435]|nr:hypothetical protein MTX20_05920 [Bradyrhizobium sp. ISRA435]